MTLTDRPICSYGWTVKVLFLQQHLNPNRWISLVCIQRYVVWYAFFVLNIMYIPVLLDVVKINPNKSSLPLFFKAENLNADMSLSIPQMAATAEKEDDKNGNLHTAYQVQVSVQNTIFAFR